MRRSTNSEFSPVPHSELSQSELHEYVTSRGKCVGFMFASGIEPDDDPWHEPTMRGPYSPRRHSERARRACEGCIVKSACLELALSAEADRNTFHGYWGGTAPHERKSIVQQRTAAADLAEPVDTSQAS